MTYPLSRSYYEKGYIQCSLLHVVYSFSVHSRWIAQA